ncbi:EipB family protein [Aestuariivirga sp.]|uniref:EipB family protein n=1 Tax=Aestuariivirga sp. TaxID=2650926 RepID=UPI003BAA8C8E
MKTVLPFLAALFVAGAADAATVAPHRAIYDLTLLRANEGASLQSAAGKLAFEIDGSTCEGFTVNFRMATKYRPDEGDVTVIDTMTTTYESPGATELRHQLKETVDGAVKDTGRIKVTRASADAEGQGVLSTKPNEPFAIPAGAALPMQHQLRLMALGEAGGGRDSSIVFDGSDGEKSFRAISFVGRQKPPGSIVRDTANPAAAPLKTLGAWPITVSYYALDGKTEEPEYQVSFDMYENGVATGLVLDYGDFALGGTLSQLTLLDKQSCP